MPIKFDKILGELREEDTGGGAVDSVNGDTGVVVLSAADVGAAPALGTDDNYVTDSEKANLHAPGSDNQDLSGYATKTGAETLTNKTLTSPSLDNPSVTGVMSVASNGLIVGTDELIVTGGKVGIGVSPLQKLHVSGVVQSTSLYLNGANGQNKRTLFFTDGVARWDFGVNATAESGGNTGSDFVLNRYADDGSYLDTPFSFLRYSGESMFGNFNTMISVDGKLGLGVGFSTPTEMLEIQGNAEIMGSSNGLILTSPNSARWKVQATNAGTLTITSI